VNQGFLGIPACAALAPAGSSPASADSASAAYDPNDGGTNPNIQIEVEYQVDEYADAADAAAVMAIMESPGIGTCFESVLTTTGSGGETVSDLAVTALELPSAATLGIDAATGVEVTATVTTPKGTASTVIHLVALQHGSALGVFTVTEVAVDGSTPPPLEVSDSAVEAAATKLATLGS
jgi:hypothetical protein